MTKECKNDNTYMYHIQPTNISENKITAPSFKDYIISRGQIILKQDNPAT